MRTLLNKIQLLNSEGIIYFIVMMSVNAGNYLVNLILGRWLSPVEFSQVTILSTLVLIISFLGLAFQMSAAKKAAEFIAMNNLVKLKTFTYHTFLLTWITGIIFGTVFYFSSQWMESFLNFNSPSSFRIFAISIPFYFVLCSLRGLHQGKNQFKLLSYSFSIEMLIRLTFTIILLTCWNKGFIFLDLASAIALTFLGSFVISYAFSTSKLIRYRLVPNYLKGIKIEKEILIFMGLISTYELSQIIISYGDFIWVKHTFTEDIAGMYAGLSLVGRMVYYSTWVLVTLLFPKVIHHQKTGGDHLSLFYRSLGLVVLIGVSITVTCYLSGTWIIELLFGSAYTEAGAYLGPYALATTLFALSNIFAYYYMSLNIYHPIIISLLVGIGQIIIITLLGTSISNLITIQIFNMGILLLTMFLFHISKNYKNGKIKNSYRISISSK